MTEEVTRYGCASCTQARCDFSRATLSRRKQQTTHMLPVSAKWHQHARGEQAAFSVDVTYTRWCMLIPRRLFTHRHTCAGHTGCPLPRARTNTFCRFHHWLAICTWTSAVEQLSLNFRISLSIFFLSSLPSASPQSGIWPLLSALFINEAIREARVCARDGRGKTPTFRVCPPLFPPLPFHYSVGHLPTSTHS